ncbi:MAG: ABC transporter ATP-binding protein [Pseudomonadota bacterium]|nr:ABC transporter ATP-binding protein [Pseudomonadota bacterium]
MIEIIDVHKRYYTDHGVGPWVLRGINLTIPARCSVGLVGRNGAGKSTLLRIVGGVDYPTKGEVRRHCNVSWPMGFGGGLQGSMTGRQNTKFVARIHGMEHDMARILRQVQDFAEIGAAFEEPIKTYSSGMRSRLQFALSLAFDFDVYISDEITATGDRAFQAKATKAFKDMVGKASIIMASHSDNTLKNFCQAGIWLHQGQAHWFDQIDEALRAYNDSISSPST